MPQSEQHNNFASYAVDRAESITLITSLPIYGGECIENCDVAEEKVIFWQFSTGYQKSPKTALLSSVYGFHITVLCHAQCSHARLIRQVSQTNGQRVASSYKPVRSNAAERAKNAIFWLWVWLINSSFWVQNSHIIYGFHKQYLQLHKKRVLQSLLKKRKKTYL